MGHLPKTRQGATLLELMLVMSISSLLIMIGLNMYQGWQTTTNLLDVQANVDLLFQAAASYLRANCATGGMAPTPEPFLAPYPVYGGEVPYGFTGSSFFLPLSGTGPTSLQPYLPANWPAFPNPLVNSYSVILNAVIIPTPMAVNACVVTTPGTACTQMNGGTNSTILTSQASVVSWSVQVAVSLQPLSNITAYASFLGADCTKSSFGLFVPCASFGPPYNPSNSYLTWTRMPSIGISRNNSIFFTSMQSLNQERLQSTHDQNYEFNQGYNSGQNPVYYLCGG